MASYNGLPLPTYGEKSSYANGRWSIPDNPIIPYIEGDGTGRDIWHASSRVFGAAVEKAYAGRRRVVWYEVFAGEKAFKQFNNWLPDDTVNAIRELRVAIKGPLTTPIGGGIRSLNVTLRQVLDLYCCVRPVRYYKGVPSPVKDPGRMDMVIFRENTEDVYAGVEWKQGTAEAKKLIDFLNSDMLKGKGKSIRQDSGIGIKPISIFATKRLVRRAIQYAIENRRRIVTLVHKGNIQKFTEGAFRAWGYEVAKEEFPDQAVSWDDCAGQPGDRVLIKDVIGHGIFEATHGTAPKYAGQDKVNPCSLLLSGVLMLEHLGWQAAADDVIRALEAT